MPPSGGCPHGCLEQLPVPSVPFVLPFSGATIDDLPQGMNVLLFTDKRCKGQRGDVKDIFKGTINQRQTFQTWTHCQNLLGNLL